MIVNIKWPTGDQFNVEVCSKEGAEPFITVKGCRLVNGRNGDFVSWPATKNQQTGKFWQHVWASEKFAAVVLSTAQETRPRTNAAPSRSRPQDDGGEDSIPF